MVDVRDPAERDEQTMAVMRILLVTVVLAVPLLVVGQALGPGGAWVAAILCFGIAFRYAPPGTAGRDLP